MYRTHIFQRIQGDQDQVMSSHHSPRSQTWSICPGFVAPGLTLYGPIGNKNKSGHLDEPEREHGRKGVRFGFL